MNELLWPYTHQERQNRLIQSVRRETASRILCSHNTAAEPHAPAHVALLKAWVARLLIHRRARVGLHR